MHYLSYSKVSLTKRYKQYDYIFCSEFNVLSVGILCIPFTVQCAYTILVTIRSRVVDKDRAGKKSLSQSTRFTGS